MRKRVFGRHLSRAQKGRRALLRALIAALVKYGKITTTYARAKAISAQVDKLVSSARQNSVSARRKVFAYLGNDKETTNVLFAKVAKTFKDRNSGFTRIILLGNRKGDNAPMVRMEWVEQIAGPKANDKNIPTKKRRS